MEPATEIEKSPFEGLPTIDPSKETMTAEVAEARNPKKRILVTEIFGPTIQGEGGMIGVKTVFLRTAGCDYRCTKCDSMHSVEPKVIHKLHEEGKTRLMFQSDIFQELQELCAKSNTEWVTISGGNPAMWDMMPLVMQLKAVGLRVAVETQGTLWKDWLAEVDHLTISPKGPGMGEKFVEGVFRKFLDQVADNYNRMTGKLAVSVKVVVFDAQDLEFAVGIDDILDSYNTSPNTQWWPRHDRYLSLGNPFPPILTPDGTAVNEDTVDQWKIGGRFYSSLQAVLLDTYHELLEMDYLPDPRLSHWKFLPQLHVLVWANKAGV